MDNFVWTKHVKQRSEQRGITQNEVWSTLRHPEKTQVQSDGSYKFYKHYSGRLLGVVARPQGNKWLIITTFTKDGPRYHPKQPLIQKLVFKAVVSLGNFISRLFSSKS